MTAALPIFPSRQYASRYNCGEQWAAFHYRLFHKFCSFEHPLFDRNWVDQRFPGSIVDPLSRFLLAARKDRLASPTPFFRAEWYLSHYDDVAESGQNAFIHYINHGAGEGRKPNPWYEFPPFTHSPADYFQSFSSLDDWIERTDRKRLITSDWLKAQRFAPETDLHSSFWKKRQHTDVWPFNPESILGPLRISPFTTTDELEVVLDGLSSLVLETEIVGRD